MRQPIFLRGGGSLTQMAAIGASFCKADGTRVRPSDGLDVFISFMSSRRDGVGILEPRFSSAIIPRHNFRFILSPSMGHPQAPLKMRNVRKSKVSNPTFSPSTAKASPSWSSSMLRNCGIETTHYAGTMGLLVRWLTRKLTILQAS